MSISSSLPSAFYICIPAIKNTFLKQRYFDLLGKEINQRIPSNSTYSIDCLYINCQSNQVFESWALDTFDRLKNRIPIDSNTEVTVEVDFNNIQRELLLFLQKSCVNRICVRVASPEAVAKVRQAMTLCACLFENNALDIHINAYSDNITKWIDFLSMISLDTVKHFGFYIGEQYQSDLIDALYNVVQKICDQYGLIQYESFHFARNGYASRYMNILWNRKPYIGLGIGAESFDGVTRSKNTQKIEDYIDAISSKKTAFSESEALTSDQIFLEHLMLSMRVAEGCNVDNFIKNKSTSYQQEVHDRIAYLVEQEYITYDKGVVRLQPKGYRVERAVIAYLAL